MGEHISMTVNGARRELDVEPRRLLVQAIDGYLQAFSDLEEPVEVPVENRDDEFHGAEQPNVALVGDLRALLIEAFQRLRVACDHPARAGDVLDRDRLTHLPVVHPQQGELNRAIQDRRPWYSNRFVQRVRHPVVEAERAAKDFDLLPVISGEIDPQQLIVADAIDSPGPQIDLAVAAVGAGEERSDAHRADK